MTKLIFIDDFFRIDFWQAKRFMYDIVNASAKAVFAQEIIYPRHNIGEKIIDIQKIYDLAGFDKDNKTFWIRNFNKIPSEVEQYLTENLPKDAVYFSYEAPNWLINLFKSADLKFIDIRLSYLRFMRDIPVLISTNVPEIASKIMNNYKLSREEIVFEADLMAAKLKHCFSDAKNREELDKSIVFIGQTEQDTSIMDINQNIAKISDYASEIQNISKNYKKIFYKEHPYASVNHKKFELDTLTKITQADVKIINDNVYEMFAYPFDIFFVGLSSGALKEGTFFGKPTKTLLQYPFEELIQNGGNITFINVSSNHFFSPAFWQDCLSPFLTVKRSFDDYSYKYPNIMRDYHNVSWGYGYLQSRYNVLYAEMFDVQWDKKSYIINDIRSEMKNSEAEINASIKITNNDFDYKIKLLNDIIKLLNDKYKIYFEYYRYKLLSTILFGKKQNHYKEKKELYKSMIRKIKELSRV